MHFCEYNALTASLHPSSYSTTVRNGNRKLYIILPRNVQIKKSGQWSAPTLICNQQI